MPCDPMTIAEQLQLGRSAQDDITAATQQCHCLCRHNWFVIPFHTLKTFIEPRRYRLISYSHINYRSLASGAAVPMCWPPCHLIGVNKVNRAAELTADSTKVTTQRSQVRGETN